MSANEPVHVIIVSNRGPYSFSVRDGQVEAARGAGGLVTAISAVARTQPILWISAALGKGDREWVAHTGDTVQHVEDMDVRMLIPDPKAYDLYYNVISNPLLWFLQHQMHDTPRHPMFDQTMWAAWREGYAAVNRLFADTVADSIAGLDGRIIVMPQDYHLYLFPRYLRERVDDRVTIHAFLHIPFPGADAWRILPLALRRDLMDGMLHADRLGFQTERDTRRFLTTVVDVLPDVRVTVPWRAVSYHGRRVAAAPYPISIDPVYLEARLDSPDVTPYLEQFRRNYADRRLILRVDRVEPSKNIVRGFIAYRNFLRTYPEYRERVEMLALLVPSRVDVPEYRTYLREIMALVGEVNATLGTSDWEPIRLLLGNNYDRAIAALSLYDVLLVNPLADGMNLVAKEGAVLNRRAGVLILSDEAGAAEEFGDAPLLVSPYDISGTRLALHAALTMPEDERQTRAERLRAQVHGATIHDWFGRQLRDALGGT